MIESTESGTMVTGAEDIEALRLLALRAALRLEIRTGLKRSGTGRSTLALVNEAMGTKHRRKMTAYNAFDAWLVSKYPGRVNSKPLS